MIMSKGTDSAMNFAKCFFEYISKLHGLPKSTVSDRDPKVTSQFWGHSMKCRGTHLKMSTSYPTQTDGSTEIMNRMIGDFL